MKITAKALRTRVLEMLDCLDRGEPVTITYRGKPRAKLVSIERDGKGKNGDSDRIPAFGMWSDRGELKDVDGYVRKLRRGRFHADRH